MQMNLKTVRRKRKEGRKMKKKGLKMNDLIFR